MLELGSLWMDKEKSIGREVREIAQIATVGGEGVSEMTFYRFDKYWPFYTEEEITDKYYPVKFLSGNKHVSNAA